MDVFDVVIFFVCSSKSNKRTLNFILKLDDKPILVVANIKYNSVIF